MAVVRRAEPHDLAALRDLFGHLSPDIDRLSDDRAAAVWADILADNHIATFVCDADGRLVASCTLITAPNLMRGGTPHGFLENVVTHGDVRRQGHGRAVIATALQEAWMRGCERVILVTGRHLVRPYVLDFYMSAASKTVAPEWSFSGRVERVSADDSCWQPLLIRSYATVILRSGPQGRVSKDGCRPTMV